MVTKKLSEFVVDTAAGSIPDALIQKAHDALLDTLGVTLAGAREDASGIAQAWAAETGARPVSRILGTAQSSSPAEAAFANGIAAHALDFDDSLPSMRGHPSATLVPVILAVGEAARSSGREVLTSYLLALEIGGKLGRAIGHNHYLRGWHSTSTIGAFTATAAAARLWRLDGEQLRTAWGIAASMSSGLVRNFGTMTKPFHTGHAARVGITAAWMARSGLSADPAIFDGDNGFLQVYGFGEGENLADLAVSLGQAWEIERPGMYVKGWPCCYCNHRPVGGLLQLMTENDIKPDDIREIAVGFVPGSDRALIKDNPQTGLEAKFSIEYAAAAAALDGTLGLDSFTDEAVHRPRIRALMKRVRRYRVEAEGIFSGVVGFTDVTVETGKGSFSMRVDRVPGSPEWPLSPAEREHKFLDCAARALGLAGARSLLALGRRASQLHDISELTAASVPEQQATAGKRA